MDRKQKINGRASKVSNLRVTRTFIHKDYKAEPCDGVLSDTGKLEVLKVFLKSGDGPSFIARWDQRPEHLDIDMDGAPNSAIRKFKANKGGYTGHHTTRPSDPDTRLFDIKIQTPMGMIFDGTVSFSLTFEMAVNIGCTTGVTVETRVIRAGTTEAE